MALAHVQQRRIAARLGALQRGEQRTGGVYGGSAAAFNAGLGLRGVVDLVELAGGNRLVELVQRGVEGGALRQLVPVQGRGGGGRRLCATN